MIGYNFRVTVYLTFPTIVFNILTGFFGDLLSLVCQSFSMVDMVLLLHGNAQPLSRIQPQLTDFFTEHYLQGREPTDANIAVSSAERIPPDWSHNELHDVLFNSLCSSWIKLIKTFLLH